MDKACFLFLSSFFLASCNPSQTADAGSNEQSKIASFEEAMAPSATNNNSADIAPIVQEVTESEQTPSTPPTSRAFVPNYDTATYCAQVSDVVGGSFTIEKGCRDQERQAQMRIRSRNIPDRVANYCDEVARVVGGSYSIFDGCVDQELEAAASM